jgi:hypothetical protein
MRGVETHFLCFDGMDEVISEESEVIIEQQVGSVEGSQSEDNCDGGSRSGPYM